MFQELPWVRLYACDVASEVQKPSIYIGHEKGRIP
jgi:hypothetical protein